jgi:hypothetical protein
MSRYVRIVVALALLGVVIAALGIAGLAALGGDSLAHAVVTVDGHEVTLASLHGSGLLLAGLAFVVLIALALVLPFAIVVPLLAVALALALAFVAIVGTLAFALSPLILLALLVWLIWRIARPVRAGTS